MNQVHVCFFINTFEQTCIIMVNSVPSHLILTELGNFATVPFIIPNPVVFFLRFVKNNCIPRHIPKIGCLRLGIILSKLCFLNLSIALDASLTRKYDFISLFYEKDHLSILPFGLIFQLQIVSF